MLRHRTRPAEAADIGARGGAQSRRRSRGPCAQGSVVVRPNPLPSRRSSSPKATRFSEQTRASNQTQAGLELPRIVTQSGPQSVRRDGADRGLASRRAVASDPARSGPELQLIVTQSRRHNGSFRSPLGHHNRLFRRATCPVGNGPTPSSRRSKLEGMELRRAIPSPCAGHRGGRIRTVLLGLPPPPGPVARCACFAQGHLTEWRDERAA